MRRGDESLLEETGGKLMMLEPRSPEGYVLHGHALLMKKDQAGAEADLKRAIAVAPDNAVGYARMGDLRTTQKKFDEAQKYYSEALQRNPSAVGRADGLGKCRCCRNSRRLLQIVQDQIAKVPNKAASTFSWSSRASQSGFRESRAGLPESRGPRQEQRQRIPDAFQRADFPWLGGSSHRRVRSALQSNPRDIRIYVALGSLLETRNQWQEAEDLYKKALEIQPDYALAANNLGLLDAGTRRERQW